MERLVTPESALASTLLQGSTLASPSRWKRSLEVNYEDPFDRAEAAVGAMYVLLAFLTLTEFRPSEPFLVDFLVSKQLTRAQVIDDVFDLWIYWRLPALLVMGVVAECIGCARTILIGAAFGTVTVAMTCFCTSLVMIQVTQFTVAISTATHTGACFALVFELSSMTFSEGGYQLHVHWAKAAFLFSNCASGLIGSALRQGFVVPYTHIWQVSLSVQLASLAVACWLTCRMAVLQAAQAPSAHRRSVSCLASDLWLDLCRSFRLRGVARWTLWSVTTHSVHLMVGTFWQALLRGKTHTDNNFNGFASAASFMLSTAALLGLAKEQRLADRQIRWSVIVMSLFSSGLLVCCMGRASHTWQFYSAYVSYEVVFSVSGAIALQQIGAEIREEAVSCDAPGRGTCSRPQCPRLALMLSITEILASLVQSALQFAFTHLHDAGEPAGLRARFDLLGAALCCGAGLLVLVRLAALLPARRAG